MRREDLAAPVLVTGASGFVGGAICARLVHEGRTVRALARTAEAERAVAGLGAEPVRGDILDRASLDAAMCDCRTVYHAAGVNLFCLRDPAPMWRANVEGSRNVMLAAAVAGVSRVVYTSSAAVIGEPKGVRATETTVHRGWFLSDYERSKHEAERIVLASARQQRIAVVCVNPSSVQGPGRVRGTAKLLLDVLNGRLPAVVESRMSLVDVDDCTEAHVLAEIRGAPGERYLVSGATLTVGEAIDLLAAATPIPRRPRTIPPLLARGAGAGLELVGRIRGRRPPLCREMVRTMLHGHAYDGSHAERALELSYTPIEETIRKTLAWYRAQGLFATAPR